MYKKIVIFIIFIAMSVFYGCDYDSVDFEIGLQFTDIFSSDYNVITREVVLIFPEGAEDIISRIIVQARAEGWKTYSGPGHSTFYGKSEYGETSTMRMDDVLTGGEVLRAEKKFYINNINHKYIFTKLFGPYYCHAEDGQILKTKGYLNAKNIKYQMRYQFVNYLVQKGIDYQYAEAFVGNVKIAYPISWRVVLPTNEVKSNCGQISTIENEENKNIMVIEHNMYEGEFLAQFPLTMAWKKWPTPNYILITVFSVVIVGLICFFVNIVVKNNRRNRIRKMMAGKN